MLRAALERCAKTQRELVSRMPNALVNVLPFRAFSTDLGTEGRQRVVLLGTGWAAARFARELNLKQFQLTVISPQNHMAFTPLLPSAAVGSVSSRSTAINMRDIQPLLAKPPHHYYSASATSVDFKANTVSCQDTAGSKFDVPYDSLVISTGSQGSTFGIPGVQENALFLRTVLQAETIRNELIKTWGLAFSPANSKAKRDDLLHTVVVGGGPTGVEFAGELCDLIKDLGLNRPGAQARVTIVEAMSVLGSFDSTLRDYAIKRLQRAGARIIEKGAVKELKPHEAVLSTGEVLKFGVCVWSTGVGPTPFIESLQVAKTARGRIAVNEFLQLLAQESESSNDSSKDMSKEQKIAADEHDEKSVEQSKQLKVLHARTYALGDCCANIGTSLPALAQVAEQQGKYLADTLNNLECRPADKTAPFVYRSQGSMAYIGGGKAIIELGRHGNHVNWKGWTSYLAWKSAYFSKLFTWRNQAAILANWIGVKVFGRDISHF